MYFLSGSVRIRCVSTNNSIGQSDQYLTVAQLAVGCSQFDTYVVGVMSGDKVSVRLSMRT